MYRALICSALFAAAMSAGCTTAVEKGGETKTIVVRETANELEKEPVPGTQTGVWEEFIVDTVRVPGRIHGVTWRLPHTTLMEIRSQKYQKVQYPDFNGQYPGAR